ncbi:MAG: hypothetical protein HY861_02080 [Chlamydiia bacterium]|nr:hypothetical protein [Chlamydiia bacterium]
MRCFSHPQKGLFFILLVLSGVVAAYFSYRLVVDLWSYGSRKESVGARIFRWEVKAEGDRYAISAHYFFEVMGMRWEGVYVFPKPWHLNEGAAAAYLEEHAKDPRFVWYNPKNPSFSSLDREFPVGLLLKTLICYGVFCYFLIRRTPETLQAL